MKRFKKFLAALFIMAGIFTLAACGSKSGVKGELKVTSVTKDTIVLGAYFDSFEEIKNGNAVAFVECYTVNDSDNTETYKTKNSLSFNGTYTDSSTTFSSLTVDTEYKFYLKVTFDGNDETINEIIKRTPKTGSSSDTAIQIATKDDFLKMKEDPSAYYELTADIDFTADGKATDFESIFSETKKFTGGFDGKGHTISGLKLKTATYMGVFGYVAGKSDNVVEIKNVKFENISTDITRTTCYLGVVAGYTENAKISNVTIGANEEGKKVDLTLTCNTTAKVFVGALVGKGVNTSFENVNVTNTVINIPKARLEARVGLLAGLLDGIVTDTLAKDCNLNGKITTNAYYTDSSKNSAFLYVGGFVGENDCQNKVENVNVESVILVTRDSASSSVYFDLAVGGFVGFTNGSVEFANCNTTSDITVYAGQVPTGDTEEAKNAALDKVKAATFSDRDVYVGGFVGYLNQNIVGISNCKYIVKENGISFNGAASTQKDDKDKLKGLICVSARVAGSKNDVASLYNTLTISADKVYVSAEGENVTKVVTDAQFIVA